MKVKVISRKPSDYIRETKFDIHKLPRNYDPKLHPFELPREYQRALNAVKLDNVFAKPFLGSLEGHSDVVQCMMRHPNSLSTIVSAAADGEVKIWNVPRKKCLASFRAHDGIVRAMCAPIKGGYFFTLDSNANIKQWKLDPFMNNVNSEENEDEDIVDPDEMEPMNTVIGQTVTMSMDHHWSKNLILTSGEKVELWEETRSEPLKSYSWGCDSTHFIKFNPVEHDIAVSASSDRGITLYDIRKPTPLRRVILEMKSNSISWNPMEAFTFTAANEDYDLYTFDMRNLKKPRQLHKDHIAAVISVDYSPTGREFVSGSYDKTIRIFNCEQGRSREIYHTKRMQRLTSVLWSADNKYILCGSDEMDIRIWKSNRSEKLGFTSYREDANFSYQNKLKERFQHHPQVKKIAKKRHVPQHVYNGQREKTVMVDSRKRKEASRRANSRPGTVPYISEKVKHIVREDE